MVYSDDPRIEFGLVKILWVLLLFTVMKIIKFKLRK
jgi:hypothetical protein